ncbi:MAG: AraC family transcriptional regulator [Lachnospiraceae bacterium]
MIGNRDIFLDRTDVSKFSLQLNHCGMQECIPGFSYQIDSRPYHLIHFILAGNGFFETGHKLLSLHAGQAFYIPAGVSARYYASLTDPWTYGWVGFYTNAANPFLSLLFGGENVIEFKMPLKETEQNLLSIISVTDQRVADYSRYDKDIFPGEQFTTILGLSDSLKANSRMLNFFSGLLRFQIPEDTINPVKNSPAMQAKAFMDAHYGDPVKMQDVAAALGIHPNYLCAVFKKTYGQTPSDYLRSIRMSQASMLLVLTDHSVSMIAESLGYANPFQFSAVFKSYYGLSPSAYRKKG